MKDIELKSLQKKVWGIIEWLRNPHEVNHEGNMNVPMIETTKVTHGFKYRVVNYEVYQNPNNYESNSVGNDEELAKEQRRERQGNNKYKNVKNVKNEKNEKKDNIYTVIIYKLLNTNMIEKLERPRSSSYTE